MLRNGPTEKQEESTWRIKKPKAFASNTAEINKFGKIRKMIWKSAIGEFTIWSFTHPTAEGAGFSNWRFYS